MSVPPSPVCLVTGYVRLDNPNRRHGVYVGLGRRLMALHRPVVAFLDDVDAPEGVIALPASIERCWLWERATSAALPAGNPQKDTAGYLTVQHQKTAWLADAVDRTDADVLVWIDFGVLHNGRITEGLIVDFLTRVPRVSRDRITLPSIWPLAAPVDIRYDVPNWFVAGAIAIVPRHLAAWWHHLVQAAARQQLEASGRLTWEVNTWAAVARQHPSLFETYPADHNETLFTMLRP